MSLGYKYFKTQNMHADLHFIIELCHRHSKTSIISQIKFSKVMHNLSDIIIII